MTDSFGDFKAPILINHCLSRRCEEGEGELREHGWYTEWGRGCIEQEYRDKRTGGCCKGQKKDTLKLTDDARPGGNLMFSNGPGPCRAMTQMKNKAGGALLMEREAGLLAR